MKIIKINLFNNIFNEGGLIPEFINTISYKNDKELIYKSLKKGSYEEKKNHSLFSVRLIPDYVALVADNSLKTKKVSQVNKGYAINLEGVGDIEVYVRNRFKKNSNQIFRRKRKLERCLNIRYEKYFGEISKELCDILMASLKAMLVRRFNQRNDTNAVLNSWEKIKDSVFDLVNSKKASIFVTYNDNTPIQISLQYHFGKVMNMAIPSYDIDYEKFSLGNISIYEQIKWCIENNYKFFDQGYGDLEYKRRWSNYIYNYNHQIFFNKKSFYSVLVGNFEFIKIIFKEYLKSKKVNKVVERIKSEIFKQNENDKNVIDELDYQVIDIDSSGEPNFVLEEISINNSLKKLIIDFVYTNNEHIDNVSIYSLIKEEHAYIIKGKNKTQKIILKKILS